MDSSNLVGDMANQGTMPLWRTLVREGNAGLDPEGMATIIKVIADSVPCLRLSGGIDFTSANDVRKWLYAEAARARGQND